MGITGRTRGRSLGPAPPIPADEGSDRRAANPRASARVGRGVAEGDAGSRRLRLRHGAAHHGGAPGAQARSLGRLGRRRGVAARAIWAPGVGSALGARSEEEAGAGGRELAQLAAARVASRSDGLAGRPQSPPPRARKGALSAESHSRAEAQGAPPAPGAGAPDGSAGNSRPTRQPLKRRVGPGRGRGRGRRQAAAEFLQRRESPRAPRWGQGGGELRERREAHHWSPALLPSAQGTRGSQGSQPPFLLPSFTPLPPLCLLSLPFSPLYAILRD